MLFLIKKIVKVLIKKNRLNYRKSLQYIFNSFSLFLIAFDSDAKTRSHITIEKSFGLDIFTFNNINLIISFIIKMQQSGTNKWTTNQNTFKSIQLFELDWICSTGEKSKSFKTINYLTWHLLGITSNCSHDLW